MKNLIKSIVFISIFVILYCGLSYMVLPKENIKDFGLYKTSMYEILGEKNNSIDVVALGDSLVYSSIIPMEIYNKYGYTVFDCSHPAITMKEAYKYFEVAVKSQKPKVAIIGANMFFRNAKNKPCHYKYTNALKNVLPLFTYHNNWKNIMFSETGLMNIEKGYKINKKRRGSENFDYMVISKKKYEINQENIMYLEKIIELAKEYNVKITIMGFPSQTSWNLTKDNLTKNIAQKYGFDYININHKNELDFDWTRETKDKGSHLNYYGALKATDYVGKYLENLNILEDHRKDENYEDWDLAYKQHKLDLEKN